MNKNEIDIRVIAKDLASSTLSDVKKQIGGLGDASAQTSKQSNLLTGAVAGVTAAVTTLGISIISSGIENITNWFGDAIDKASQMETALITLSLVAPRFGTGADEATEAAERLAKELKIGVGPVAESLQNLLKSGIGLDKAEVLMKRFTDAALGGKSANISLSDAVKNLSFAYVTNNSTLGNMSGIQENFSDIVTKGREALIQQGVAVETITDDMAKYQGILEYTNDTMGVGAAISETYAGKQIELNTKMELFQTKIGELLLPIMEELLTVFTDIFDEAEPHLTKFANELIPEIGRILKDEIVPKVKEFIEYLGSEQFQQDTKKLKEDFEGVKGTISTIAADVGKFTGDLTSFAVNNPGLVAILKDLGQNPGQLLFGFAPTAIKGITGSYAEGTDFHPGGMALVGERGPEIVNLPRGSQVIPNGQGMSNVFNFYGYDMDRVSTTINNQVKYGY